jgi:hypothetical protein
MSTIPSCTLAGEDVRAQRDRLARLGESVANLQRGEDRITIAFRPGFDEQLLDEVLTVERRCCPFLRFEFDESTRRVTVSVEDLEHVKGLDALAGALGAARLA